MAPASTVFAALESGGHDKIATWMLDPDYDGRSLLPRQVFFPAGNARHDWNRLAKNLKAKIDPSLIETYRGTVSLSFKDGKYGHCAVKIVADRGMPTEGPSGQQDAGGHGKITSESTLLTAGGRIERCAS